MGPERLPSLTDPNLHAGIVYEAAFATDQRVSEETGGFANLFAPLDLRFSEVTRMERIELATIGANDSRAIAQQFARTRGREEPYLGAGKFIFIAGRLRADEFGDRISHDGVVAVFGAKPVYVDPEQAEDHRRILHSPVLPDEGREAGHRDDISVTARIDCDLGRDRRTPLLGVCNNPVDFIATLDQRAEHRRVEEDLDARFRQ